MSDDGLEYTFHLRQGVKFQDGTDFNADAVKVNIERQMAGNATADMTYADFVYGYVTSVDVVDDYTVKVTLKDVCTPFLYNLAMSMAAPLVSPTALEKYDGQPQRASVGTAPTRSSAGTRTRPSSWCATTITGVKSQDRNVIFRIIRTTRQMWWPSPTAKWI